MCVMFIKFKISRNNWVEECGAHFGTILHTVVV